MKVLKILQVIGVLLLVFGMVRACGALPGDEFSSASIGVIGLFIYAVAKTVAWIKSDKQL